MATTNTLFAVLAVSDAAAVEEKLSGIAPWLVNQVAEGQWLVIAPGSTTTKEVSDKIGVSEGESGNGIVLRTEGYFGRAPSAIWEWISAKIGVALDAAPK